MDFNTIDVLLRLIIAHLLVDFPLQSDIMVAEKKKGLESKFFYLHVLTVGIVTYILLAEWSNWQGPLIIMLIHGIIDLTKAKIETKAKWAPANAKWLFIMDQTLHLITLISYWIISSNVITNIDLFQQLFNQKILWNADILIVVTAYLLITIPFGVLIGFITKKWQDEIAEDDETKINQISDQNYPENESLKDAGKTIGIIERTLVLTFILTQQYQAIGFLIAAKSVFRFGDLKESGQRKRTEYILIGTLISFILSIMLGILTQFLISKF